LTEGPWVATRYVVRMHARVLVTLKKGVLDPAGEAVAGSLRQLGFEEVRGARIGKVIEIDLGDVPQAEAEKRLREMGQKLLANTVIEDFEVVL
jgi:phosphoribosylformylglycinamidine synthase PurS subunit